MLDDKEICEGFIKLIIHHRHWDERTLKVAKVTCIMRVSQLFMWQKIARSKWKSVIKRLLLGF